MGNSFPQENNRSNNDFVCGLCSDDFTSFQSLINHIELHIHREDLNHFDPQIQPMPNYLQSNFPINFLEPEQQSVGNNNGVADVTPFSAPVSTWLHEQGGDTEVSLIDGTKPYINMLDKPIDNNVSSIINDKVNLELKL